jgi:hypothetical protein
MKPVGKDAASTLIDDLVMAISLNECAQRSASDQDIGS